jgi:hypothetical protein
MFLLSMKSMSCLVQTSFSFEFTSSILVFTSISYRAVIPDNPIRESGNLFFTLTANSSIFFTHSFAVCVGMSFVPACIKT